MLELQKVTFKIAERDLLIDLVVKPKAILGLLGENGSGKSTILNLVAGFYFPTSGRILFDGHDITYMPSSERPINILFQENNLFPNLTAKENIIIGMSANLRLTPEETDLFCGIVQSLHLDKALLDRYPNELSGGEKQKVALARCLLRKKQLLLLDEAFAALSPASRFEMLHLVKEIQQKNELTIVMVSHQPEDCVYVCDEIALIGDGKVLKVDKTNKLLDPNITPEIKDYLGQDFFISKIFHEKIN